MRVDGSYEVVNVAWPVMSEELDDDLHEYGFYEVFAAAEQLWAIDVGLVEPVVDFTVAQSINTLIRVQSIPMGILADSFSMRLKRDIYSELAREYGISRNDAKLAVMGYGYSLKEAKK